MGVRAKAIGWTVGIICTPLVAFAECRNEDLYTQIEQCSVMIATSTDERNKSAGYLYRCQAYDLLKLYDHAFDDCQSAQSLAPQDSSIYNSISIIEQNRGNISAAIEAASRAIELRPSSSGHYNTRANAYCAAGEYERSVNDRIKSMELGRFTPERLQEILKTRGYYNGPIDGQFGNSSRQALFRWTQAGC